MASSLLGAEEAAGGRTLRRPARETWGHLHPPLRWTPHLNGSTRTGTTSGGRKKRQQRSLVSRSACKNMNTGYKDKTPSAYLKIRAAQTGIVTVYKKGANLEIPEHRHREASNGFKRLIMHTSEKCTFRWIQVYFCCCMKFVFRSLIHLVWGQFVTMEEKFKGALCLFTLHFYSLLGIIQCICVNLGFWPWFLSSQPEWCEMTTLGMSPLKQSFSSLKPEL